MRTVIKVGCFVSLFLMIGCAHIPFLGKSSQPAVGAVESIVPEQPVESNRFVEKGRIVDASRLRRGKNVAVIPFKAGVGVEANEELERVTLMIVKGIADTFADDQRGLFTIVTAENLEAADFAIQGHVTSLKGPSRVKRWVLLKGHKMLGVDGKMIDAKTGETVAVFTDQVTSQTENYKDLGHQIGKNIGLFVLSGTE